MWPISDFPDFVSLPRARGVNIRFCTHARCAPATVVARIGVGEYSKEVNNLMNVLLHASCTYFGLYLGVQVFHCQLLLDYGMASHGWTRTVTML